MIATAVPTPVVYNPVPIIENALQGVTSTAVVKPATLDRALDFAKNTNANAAMLELLWANLTGVSCVMTGLVLSAGTGLSVNISFGTANIGGPVQPDGSVVFGVPSAISYNVPASQSNVFIWLKQDGSITHTLSTTAPGGGPSVYLGWCSTSASAVTAVSRDGVLTLISGALHRTTTDNGMPTDTLPSGVRVYTKTAFNTYFWDGSGHRPVSIPQVTADPASPQPGDTWFRTDTSQYKVKTSGSIVAV